MSKPLEIIGACKHGINATTCAECSPLKVTKPREEFEKARDAFTKNEYVNRLAKYASRDGANWAYDYRQAEIEQLKKIIAKCPNENDDLGAEYVHVCILQREIDRKDKIIARLKKTFERIENGEYVTDPDSNFAARLCDIREEVTQVLDDVVKMEAGDE